MLRHGFIMALLAMSCRMAHANAESDSLAADTIAADTLSTVTMDEVQVVAETVTRDDDHLNIIPTTQQKEHAQGGYALLASLMIPGMNVSNGSVSTMGMATTLYTTAFPPTWMTSRTCSPGT